MTTTLARNVANPLTIYTTLSSTSKTSTHEENARFPRKVTGGLMSFRHLIIFHSYLIPLPIEQIFPLVSVSILPTLIDYDLSFIWYIAAQPPQ